MEEEYASMCNIMNVCVERVSDGSRCEADIHQSSYCIKHYSAHRCAYCNVRYDTDQAVGLRFTVERLCDLYKKIGHNLMKHFAPFGVWLAASSEERRTPLMCPACVPRLKMLMDALYDQMQLAVQCFLAQEQRNAHFGIDAVIDRIRQQPIQSAEECKAALKELSVCIGMGYLSVDECRVYDKLKEAREVFKTNPAYAQCIVQDMFDRFDASCKMHQPTDHQRLK